MRLPAHRWRPILIVLGLALVARWGLGLYVSEGLNDRLTMHDNPDRPYADLVEVEPGAPYFFTWGVTSGPRFKHMADNPPAPDQLERSDTERYGTTYNQAHAVIQQLIADLKEVGLSLRDVANVRAYLVVDPSGKEADMPSPEQAFAEWDAVFSKFFGTWDQPHKPARTTVGITRLFHSAYRIEVEFTCVIPEGRGPLEDSTRYQELYERLERTETNDQWASYGRPIFPMSTGKATAGNMDLFFASAIRPLPLIPNAPPTMMNFGSTTQQAESIFKQMDVQLKAAGLRYEDVFFMRTIVYPDPAQPISRSFSDFNRVYSRFLNNEQTPNRPTRTIMSTPGFAHRRQYISIEYYAAYPSEAEPPPVPEGQLLGDFGETPAIAQRGAISAGGTMVPKEARMLWVSGSIPAERSGDMKAEASAALEATRAKLARVGADLDDVVQLRAYIKAGTGPETDARVAAWEEVFREHFGTEENPRQPALTTLPVVALPREALIEIEVMAAVE